MSTPRPSHHFTYFSSFAETMEVMRKEPLTHLHLQPAAAHTQWLQQDRVLHPFHMGSRARSHPAFFRVVRIWTIPCCS